jgi:MFS family permease
MNSTLSLNRNLGIIFSMVFTEFLIMGISLGILPAFIHQSLQFSNLWVGVVIGAQYATTLLTRQLAGKTADHKGGKLSAITGILFSALSGVLLLAAVSVYSLPQLSLVLVLAGRILLGAGESFLVVGIFKWGFTLVGPANTGKVMVWNGMGMYAGMACGAPLAIFLQAQAGLTTLFASTIALPVIIYLIMHLLPAAALPRNVVKLSFMKAVSLVWASGERAGVGQHWFRRHCLFHFTIFHSKPLAKRITCINRFRYLLYRRKVVALRCTG